MGHMMFSLAIGCLIAIIFWYPFLGLERAIIGRADSSLKELKAEMINDMKQEQELFSTAQGTLADNGGAFSYGRQVSSL